MVPVRRRVRHLLYSSGEGRGGDWWRILHFLLHYHRDNRRSDPRCCRHWSGDKRLLHYDYRQYHQSNGFYHNREGDGGDRAMEVATRVATTIATVGVSSDAIETWSFLSPSIPSLPPRSGWTPLSPRRVISMPRWYRCGNPSVRYAGRFQLYTRL